MAKLTYWCANIVGDAGCYSIRRRTRKECLEGVKQGEKWGNKYEAPQKVALTYEGGAFGLLQRLMGESFPIGDNRLY